MSDYTTENNIAELAPQVLTPAKKKNHYECPICNQPKFSVDPKTGKFSCWNKCNGSDLFKIIKEKAGQWNEKREKQHPEPLINGQGLTEKHYEDFANSGVPAEIVNEVACGTDNCATIAKFLGWGGYYGDTGVIVRSVDIDGKLTEYGQYKPSKPHKWNRPDKKDSKYLSAGGAAQAVLVPVPGVDWQEARDDISRPIFITEGYKKAIKIMIHEWDLPDEEYKKFPCISLNGVTLWHEKEKEDVLVPRLEEFAQYKRRFIIAFDADYRTNSQVRTQLKKLAKRLLERGCQVDVAFWPNTKQTKGIDDLLVAGKEDQLQIKPFDEWLKIQDKKDNADVKDQVKKERLVLPSQNECANELVDKYRGKLVYISHFEEWYIYKDGIWQEQHKDFIDRDVILPYLDSIDQMQYTDRFLSSVRTLMAKKICVDRINQIGNKLPFLNGCLDLTTMQLEEHKPSNYLLWCLPYNYDPTATCEPVKEWLLSVVGGKEDQVQLLRAFLAGILRDGYRFQRYLEIQGYGGSGKSTFMNLASALVGQENTHSSTLQRLEYGHFDTAAYRGKKLALFPDSDKYGGKLEIFKQLIGGDDIPYEIKYKQQGKGNSLMYYGMVMISCNNAIQSTEYSSAITRRRIVLKFNNVASVYDRAELIRKGSTLLEFVENPATGKKEPFGELAPYIPGVMNWVLSMPLDEIVDYLALTHESVPSLEETMSASVLETNPMANWADHFLILDPDSETSVGCAKREKDSDLPNIFQKWDEWLYASYSEFTASHGHKTVVQRHFTTSLIDLLSNTFKLPGITNFRNNKGSFITGIRLRKCSDSSCPLLLSGQPNQICKVMASDGTVTAESIGSDGSDASDGKININNSNFKKEEKEKEEKKEIDIANSHLLPSLPSLVRVPAVTDAVTSDGKTNDSDSICHHSEEKLDISSIPAVTVSVAYKFDGPNKEILIINKAILEEWTKMPSKIKEALYPVKRVIGGGEEYVLAETDQEKGLRMFANHQQTKVLILNMNNPAFKQIPIK